MLPYSGLVLSGGRLVRLYALAHTPLPYEAKGASISLVCLLPALRSA